MLQCLIEIGVGIVERLHRGEKRCIRKAKPKRREAAHAMRGAHQNCADI